MLVNRYYRIASLFIIAFSGLLFGKPGRADGVLPSWNAGASKDAIVNFVSRVTRPESRDYLPPALRIAVFDNDGTLWPEQPMYVQLAFTLDRLKQLAPEHPEWQTTQPYKAALEGDFKALGKLGDQETLQLLLASHGNTSAPEFEALVTNWLARSRDVRFKKPYTELAYQPMLELLDYLRANGFKTFIVSGGGAEFIRPWAALVYGIPPEQVIGSTLRFDYRLKNGKPVIHRLAEIDHINDRAGKPIGIHRHIGLRPVLAFGNSDGDFEMLEWTTRGDGPGLGLLLHHDDADREFAYDRASPFGRLSKALDEAKGRGWVVVGMKQDFNRVFAFEPSSGKLEQKPRP